MDRFHGMAIALAVAETGSLSAAARRQRTPLATVSRKICRSARTEPLDAPAPLVREPLTVRLVRTPAVSTLPECLPPPC